MNEFFKPNVDLKNEWVEGATAIGDLPAGTSASYQLNNAGGQPLGLIAVHENGVDIIGYCISKMAEGACFMPFPTVDDAKKAIEYAVFVGLTLFPSSEPIVQRPFGDRM